ncbi:MAG TPA: long-chain fatty acid--CoA ligase [Candidatus Limnocylindrales bacterium]|nr:long-chain fatty acid--CoA ligase [Candidatus Limnocylindrales bacterium]
MTGIVNSRSSTSSALPHDSIAGDLRTQLPAHADTLAGSILDRVAATPDREAFRYPGGNGAWDSMTWGQAGHEIETLAAGLVALGLRIGDRVAIASSTRLEWILADSAIMCAGGATTTIYPNTNVEDVVFILADSGTRILFAEDADQAAKAANDRDRLPGLMAIVVIDGPGDDDFIVTMDQLRALGEITLAAAPQVIDARVAQLSPDSLATLIYTSGTTGRPKGVELTHRSWVFQGASLDALGIITIEDLHYLWLPLSHSFGKVLLAFGLQVGFPTAVDGRVPELVGNLATIRPTFMAGVPRVFEKIYTAANSRAQDGGALERRVYAWAVDTSTRIKESRRCGRRTGPLARMELALADRLVFNKVTALTGGRIRYFVCGSAALAREVARWFDAAGMPILEGYGLTETSAATCLVRPDDQVFGTVGQPLPGTEIRIAPDGEILLRGPHLMTGYRSLPRENAEVLLADGWLATGDIGSLDDSGRLRITDRKKDLVKTSGGKYIAPGAIAARFQAMTALGSHLIVHANNRNYVTALVSLDPETLVAFGAAHGMSGDHAALSQTVPVRAAIHATIDELNATLNRWETIKKFTILSRDLTEARGELTTSLKVKRKVVEQHFAHQLDAMYT